MPGQPEVHRWSLRSPPRRLFARHNSVLRPRHGSGQRLSIKHFCQGTGDASSLYAIASLECEALCGLVRIGNVHEAGAKSPKLS
ncbi:unnamed protein product [Fusarium venenatum]|uniref:Uncharacterized protein n=1 Tax=Fusarium venenatum TaxID=56646 RepID=A0A2L2TP90_9HYPO|nr:uncharacterized protein FVRRES_05671 [Fusarium venenatum]CEI61235.1 unnamed protein product [Fusarium venenatum]